MKTHWDRFHTSTYLNIGVSVAFVLFGVIAIVLVNVHMRRQALDEAESKVTILLERSLATHTYFTHQLKPRLFDVTDRAMSEGYFDPIWMSSTYAVREIHKYFRSLGNEEFYYKECAINARSQENEADAYERAFLKELNSNPELTERSATRMVDGEPYFVTLRRGEMMEEACLRCHSTPERAPAELVETYGDKRSFGREVGEAVSAISIRIPLAAAYAHANQISIELSGILLLLLSGLFLFQYWFYQRFLFSPLSRLGTLASKISSDHAYLGEEIPAPYGRDMKELISAFNRMSTALRQNHNVLEKEVQQQTSDLQTANESLLDHITERKRMEEELREKEDFTRRVVDNIPVCIFVKDREGRYLLVNRQMAELHGTTTEDMIGKTNFDYVEESVATVEEVGQFRAADREVIENKKPVSIPEETFTLPDGRKRYYQTKKVSLELKDKVDCLLGVAVDITEIKQAEEQLKKSEVLYRTLVENLQQNVFLKDTELKFVSANTSFCNLLGVSQNDVVGKTDYDFYPKELADKYRADDRQVLETGEPLESIEENITNGKKTWVHVVKTPVREPDGTISGVLGIFWDITKQKDMEMQLRESHKMEAVGRMAGGVAHNINNLLTGISGNLGLIEMTTSEDISEYLSEAQICVDRAAEFVQHLLAFGRELHIQPRPVDVNRLAEQTGQFARQTIDRRIEVSVETTDSLPRALADEQQLKTILMDLCINSEEAIKKAISNQESAEAERTDFRIRIETGSAEFSESELQGHSSARPGRFVTVRVQDNGIGMDEETQSHLFEPFFTTKGLAEGKGLSLSSAHGILSRHGGWIECQSTLGVGTTFVLYLPVAEGFPSQNGESGSQGQIGTASLPKTVLLADDEDTIRNVGKNVLEPQGYTVLLAENGREAVNLFFQHAEEVDLLILDLSMPHLSGFEVLERVQVVRSDLKVLISSGYSEEDQAELMKEPNVVGYLAKPFRAGDLLEKVKEILES